MEIEVDSLTAIEQGSKRPSEDILLLLISYFGIKDEEATSLWETAGYDKRHMHPHAYDEAVPGAPQQPGMIVMPIDVRVVYTDMAHVMVNDFGVVMNFLQTAGPNNQPLAVSRVGMSHEHAKSILELLQRTLAEAEQKALPPQAPNAKKSKDSDIHKSDKQK